MKKLISTIMTHSYLPSWMVLIIDLIIYATTFILTYWLSLNIADKSLDNQIIILQMLTGIPFFYLATFLLKPHKGIIRHSTTHDATILIFTHMFITIGLLFVSLLGHIYVKELAIPYPIILIHFFISVLVMISFRFSIKLLFAYFSNISNEVHNVLIYGAGNKGQITIEVIAKDKDLDIRPIGFIDDNWQLQNKMIGGLPVYSEETAFNSVIENEKVKEIIFAINNDKIAKERKRQIINLCLSKQIKVSEVPDTNHWINGALSATQIKEVQIEDLLGREPIILNKDRISKGLFSRTILVTGAAGSIGSEMVRQILTFQPGQLILVDQAESSLFDLQTEIKEKLNFPSTVFIIGNVTDKFRMKRIFQKYRPEVVFHAAAYKHVPLMEVQPYEAIACNIGGVKVIADLSVEFEVEQFVMISTDKAVNPTNVMGATKRVCEIYIQSLSQIPNMKTHFITTRFGNVLGSNGSVVPLFKKQIQAGGPITVTHRNITRFFMTIPEACQLVLEAGFMGKGGEIFLFDMGQPIQIYDLAEKMILLSGLIPHKDIKIEVTGLRPGEKLYEELLASAEDSLPSFHNKILIGNIRKYDYNVENRKITELLNSITKETDEALVARLKDIVPEFISNNSEFESIDRQNKGIALDNTQRKAQFSSNIKTSPTI